MDIGKKIKELRLQNDLTLGDLASRSELTKGFLSQVEGKSHYTEHSDTEDILEALGSNNPTSFMRRKKKKIVFQTQDFFVDEQEDCTIEWIVPNAQKNQMEPIILTLHPRKKSQIMSAYQGQEFGYVLKGNVTIVQGSKKYKVKAKETFYMDGSKSHYLYNHGNSDAKILWITTPPMF